MADGETSAQTLGVIPEPSNVGTRMVVPKKICKHYPYILTYLNTSNKSATGEKLRRALLEHFSGLGASIGEIIVNILHRNIKTTASKKFVKLHLPFLQKITMLKNANRAKLLADAYAHRIVYKLLKHFITVQLAHN